MFVESRIEDERGDPGRPAVSDPPFDPQIRSPKSVAGGGSHPHHSAWHGVFPTTPLLHSNPSEGPRPRSPRTGRGGRPVPWTPAAPSSPPTPGDPLYGYPGPRRGCLVPPGPRNRSPVGQFRAAYIPCHRRGFFVDRPLLSCHPQVTSQMTLPPTPAANSTNGEGAVKKTPQPPRAAPDRHPPPPLPSPSSPLPPPTSPPAAGPRRPSQGALLPQCDPRRIPIPPKRPQANGSDGNTYPLRPAPYLRPPPQPLCCGNRPME